MTPPSALHPRTPVLVGAGQVTHRDGDPPSPLELMALAARRAEQDAGVGRLLRRAGSVGVVDCFSWPVGDPAALLAEALGVRPRETVRTARGGTGPLVLLGDLAGRVAAGGLDVALLAGGETVTTYMRAMRDGVPTGWPEQPEGTRPTRIVGADRDASHPAETAAGLIAPISYYPLIESAVRGAAGRTPAEHQVLLSALWARFADVARTNPHAWTADPPADPAQIGTPSPANRMTALPYPKLMTANIQVDQAAALILCSAQAAADAGVPRERWVVVQATASASDHWFVGERAALHRSPAIAACGAAVLGPGGLHDVALLDLYSCFPAAVQIAAAELGLDPVADPRAPTVTGGLTFAGGPANDYVTHALAAMVGRLREQPEERGLCTAVGWYLTKHALGVLTGPAAPPPNASFAHADVQDAVDALPRRTIAEPAAARGADVPVEAYTAVYDRDGTATMGIVAGLLEDEDGARTFAKTHDPATIAALLEGDPLGRAVRHDGASGFVTT